MDLTNNGVNVDAVMMVPHHINGLEASLQEALTTQLGRPVNVQVCEVLTADDASFALQQGTLAELRRSVAALQTAKSGRTAAQQANDVQLVRLQAKLLGYPGRLTLSADGRHWTLQVTAGPGMSLQCAQRIEHEVNTGLASDGGGITVLPPLQLLPGIVFADDSTELDADATSSLATVGWAVQRWHGNAVHVVGVGGTEALMQKRADAVAGALRAGGLQASASAWTMRRPWVPACARMVRWPRARCAWKSTKRPERSVSHDLLQPACLGHPSGTSA